MALILDALSVMNMVTLSWIVRMGYLLQEPQEIITNPNLTEATMPDHVHHTTMKTGTGEADPDHNLISADITAQVIMIHTEAVQGHITVIHVATTGAAHNTHAPPIRVTAINPAMTHHTDHITDDHPCIAVLQLTTLEITVDHSQPSYKSSRQDSHRSSSYSSGSQGKPHLKMNLKVKIEDPHRDY